MSGPAGLVLLVDGDHDCRTILRITLEHAGFSVLEAETPEAGYDVAHARIPDLVISEYPFASERHESLARALRADPALEHTAIIAFSAVSFFDNQIAAMLDGVDRFLSKPLEPRRVLREVRKLLAGATGHRDPEPLA